MNSAYIYLQLYRMFDSNTPIPADCGRLCGGACCEGDDSGMFLFPGEAAVYKLLKPEGFRIEMSDLTYDDGTVTRRTPILFCSGKCDRFMRPLSCRIFPLTPVLDENEHIKIITDPRAKKVCPLAKTFKLDEYDEAFFKAVSNAFILLDKNRHVRSFMREYTKYINEFGRFYSSSDREIK